MVSLGAVSRLCVSKEPVRSKVTVSDDDIVRKAPRKRPLLLREDAAAVAAVGMMERRKKSDAAFVAIMVDLRSIYGNNESIIDAWPSAVSSFHTSTSQLSGEDGGSRRTGPREKGEKDPSHAPAEK